MNIKKLNIQENFKDWKFKDWDEDFKIVLIKHPLCDNTMCKYYLKKRKDSWFHLHYRVNDLPKKFDNYKVLGCDWFYDRKWLKKWVKTILLEGVCDYCQPKNI